MAETTTVNFGWTMPDPGASANTWGATLNATTQKVDNQVFLNQQAGVQGSVPVGAGAMWFGAAPPTNWLICNGQPLATTGTYAALFAILGYAFGGAGANFNLPDLRSRFPMGAGTLGAAGGEATHVLTAAEMPSHTHAASQPAHTHTATQPAHVHPDPGHGHGVVDPTHVHNVPRVLLGSGVNIQPGPGFNQVTDSGTTASATGISIQAAGANLQAAGADAITVAAAQPAITVAATGGGAAHNNLPPYQQVNFIIKYQ